MADGAIKIKLVLFADAGPDFVDVLLSFLTRARRHPAASRRSARA
jgi:hypothetical protein